MTVLRCTFVFTCFLFLQSCQSVRPWQKDILAKSDMALTNEPLEVGFEDHTFFSKEASSGGRGFGGGGCGCN